jgi:pSer/pThr/pTyr-binding forkhead associated (FHA) protein
MSNDFSEKRVIHLQVISGPDEGRMFFLKMGKEALIGRAPTADLRLTDAGVSSRHCVVRSAGDMIFVEDLGSRNGIRINGEAAAVRVLDSDGKIELGTSVVELKFAVTEAEVPLAAVVSPAAPTLLENTRSTQRLATSAVPRVSGPGSTMLDEGQMQEFRAAKGMLGQTIAGFLLLEPIGIGATGPVFRAKRVKDRTEVALKLIRRADARTPELLENFIKDTRTNLQIPGAANIFEIYTVDKYAYIAMELFRGRELQAIVADNMKSTPAEIVKMAEPLCAALAAAHAKGILHRDIRPSNILIQADSTPILLELGFARKRNTEGKSIFTIRDDPMSRVRYLSPEITRTGTLDGRADMFSLAATFYFAITGSPPFQAKTPLELIRKIRWEDVAPLQGENVSESFSKAIGRALIKEPDQRYATIQDFAKALKNAVT